MLYTWVQSNESTITDLAVFWHIMCAYTNTSNFQKLIRKSNMNMLRVCKIHTLVSFLRLAEVKGVKGKAGTSSLERVAAVHERTCGERSGNIYI